MGISKVIYGGTTLIDLTGDTVTADKILKGYTAHGKNGGALIGSCNFDVDSTDATAAAGEILSGKTAYARGSKLTGDMPNNGAVAGSISTKAGKYTIPQGYHDGSGYAQIASAEQAKIIATNIREGVTILGVTGTMSGSEGMKAQTAIVTPSASQQIITPEDGYNCLSQVTVDAIPYAETDNSAGGITVTIG